MAPTILTVEEQKINENADINCTIENKEKDSNSDTCINKKKKTLIAPQH